MNKKGFTLIELLAVIVILAIIAVITVPKVAEMIDSSRKGAAEDAFYGSIKSAELAWAKGLENNPALLGVNCSFSNEGTATCSNNKVLFSTSGTNAKSGKITISDIGEAFVYAEDSLLFNGYYCCGNSSKTYCKRNSVPEVTETDSICTVGSGGADGDNNAATKLKETIVTTGEGLYADPVESNRYVYRGANPSNYIWLDLNGDSAKTDNEIYRIISVEADNTIKVVAQNSIGNVVYDQRYSNVGNNSRYSSSSTDYCYEATTTYYNGCNVWGSKTTTLNTSENNISTMPRIIGGTEYTLPLSESYLNVYLNTTFLESITQNVKNKIDLHVHNVGILKNLNGQTLITDVAQEKAYKWRGKIALINPTDYVKASTNSSCTSVNLNSSGNSSCYNNSTNHNYLFHSTFSYLLALNPYDEQEISRIWIIYKAGFIGYSTTDDTRPNIYPAFYLTSDITLTGEGTEDEPYTISG